MGENKKFDERHLSQLHDIKERVALWYQELITKSPNLQDGESMSIQFIGGRDGYSDKDEELFSVNVTTSSDEIL